MVDAARVAARRRGRAGLRAPAGVVHRDIKPENILLPGRHAVVADFGIAKAISDATAVARAHNCRRGARDAGLHGARAGQRGHEHRPPRRIYAVGVVAFELLTGQPPFTGLTAQAVLAGHITRTPESVTTLRPQVPLPVAELVRRCLEKRPADRWQHVEEMMPTLEAVAATNSGGTTSAATPPASRPGGRGRRMLAGALAATAVLILLTAAVVRYRAIRPNEVARRRVVVVVPPTTERATPRSITSRRWRRTGCRGDFSRSVKCKPCRRSLRWQ